MAAARVRDIEDLPEAPPQTDAYTWILVISLLAMLTGCILLYLDYSSYTDQKPQQPPTPQPIQVGEPAGGGNAPPPAPGPGQQRGGPANNPAPGPAGRGQ
jgi:hypothetical protein